MSRPAEGRVNGVLRGGTVDGDEFRFHAPYPVTVKLSQVSDIRILADEGKRDQ